MWFSLQVWFDCMILIHYNRLAFAARGSSNLPSNFFIYDLTKIPPFERSTSIHLKHIVTHTVSLTLQTQNIALISLKSQYTLGPFRLLPPPPPTLPSSSSSLPPHFSCAVILSYLLLLSPPSSINKYLFSFLYKHSSVAMLSAACGIHSFYLHHKHRYTSVKNEKTLILLSSYSHQNIHTYEHERAREHTPILPLRQCLIL